MAVPGVVKRARRPAEKRKEERMIVQGIRRLWYKGIYRRRRYYEQVY
jgi:hypothetical protein